MRIGMRWRTFTLPTLSVVLALVLLVIHEQPTRASAPPATHPLIWISLSQAVVRGTVTKVTSEFVEFPSHAREQLATITCRVDECWRGNRTEPLIFTQLCGVGVDCASFKGREVVVFVQSAGLVDGKPNTTAPVATFYQQGIQWIESPETPLEKAKRATLKASVQAFRADPKTDPKIAQSFYAPINAEALKPFWDLVDHSEDADLRTWAVVLLGLSCPVEPIEPRLVAVLQDKDPKVVAAAAIALKRRAYAPATEPLRKVFATMPEGYQRKEIAQYLATLRIQAVIDTLPTETRETLYKQLYPDAKSAEGQWAVHFELDADNQWIPAEKYYANPADAPYIRLHEALLPILKTHLDLAQLELKPIKFYLSLTAKDQHLVVTFQLD